MPNRSKVFNKVLPVTGGWQPKKTKNWKSRVGLGFFVFFVGFFSFFSFFFVVFFVNHF